MMLESQLNYYLKHPERHPKMTKIAKEQVETEKKEKEEPREIIQKQSAPERINKIKNLFSLNRSIFESSVFGDDFTFRLYVYCIGRANFEDTEIMFGNQVIKIQRGQFITSYQNLTQELNRKTGLSRQKKLKQVRCRIQALKRAGKLAYKGFSKYSLITVINYDDKQSQNTKNGKVKGIDVGSQRAGNGQQYNNYNNYNNKKENIKRKKNLIFDYLSEFQKQFFEKKPEFLKYKFTSPSNFERILAYFYVFEGYNFGNQRELSAQIKVDLKNFREKLENIGKYGDHEILQAMSLLKDKNKLTLANCVDKLNINTPKKQDKIKDLSVELADKMAM